MADPKRKKLGEADLKALVARELSLARTDSSIASDRRTKALEYYQGEMKDIPAETGRSSVVSRDLADVMGWMLPGIMRVFTASDRMGICEPVGDEDEELARQATDGVNYVFWKENDGYQVIYDATWDAMLAANGVVKVYWDDTPKTTISYHSGLTDDDLYELIEPDEVEVLEHSEDMENIPLETGEVVPLTVHSVKIKRTDTTGKTCVEAIPPEDYGIDSDAKKASEARFQFHRSDATRSDLIKEGWPRDKVMNLGKASTDDSAEAVARRDGEGHTPDSNESMEIVDKYECFFRVDVDGDGIAEMCRIIYAGSGEAGEILYWEEWEDQAPFYDIKFEPMPHRFRARSLFDEMEDVQRIKTVMLRQANDNTYATNNPQRFVKGKILNPEELFSPSFGGAIFGELNAEVVPLTTPFVANHAYDALNYQDQVIQRRTGVSRQTMALDPEALQNQSATANQNEKDASYSQVELVARNMAEYGGWKAVFKAILLLEIKHRDVPRTIRMGNKPVNIDPRHWNAEMDVTINVGLGTGSRDRDAQMLQSVLATQVMITDRLAPAFPDKALEMLPYIRKTLVKGAEAVGIKNPDEFYPDVTPQDIEAGKARLAEQAQQPPMELQIKQMEIQAQGQLEQQKAQAQAALEQQKVMISAEAEKLKAQGAAVKEQAQLQADLATKEADRQSQAQLEAQKQAFEREKFNTEIALRIREMDQKRELELAKIGMKETETAEVGPDGQPVAKKVPRRVHDIVADDNAALRALIIQQAEQTNAQLQRLAEILAAPVEPVYWPDGRLKGAQKVLPSQGTVN